MADQADQLRASGKWDPETKPFLGVPISLKESIFIAGRDTTAGFAARLFEPITKAEECPLYDRLIRLGAIPIVRSNFPQFLMACEGYNDIYGVTKNPHDLARSPGGSSSGEGALVSAGCVVWGIGSDIAGSIRIPALWNGVCGFKPTPLRLSVAGHTEVNPTSCHNHYTQLLIIPTMGPLARSVRDLTAISKYLLDGHSNEYDHMIPPIPWVEETAKYDYAAKGAKKLKFAYMRELKLAELAPTNRRAQETVRDLLLNQGHEMYDLTFDDEEELFILVNKLLATDGQFDDFWNNWQFGEPILESYLAGHMMSYLPDWVKSALATVMYYLPGKRRLYVSTHGGTAYPFEDVNE